VEMDAITFVETHEAALRGRVYASDLTGASDECRTGPQRAICVRRETLGALAPILREGVSRRVNRDPPLFAGLVGKQTPRSDHPSHRVSLDLEILGQHLNRDLLRWMRRQVMDGLIDEAVTASGHS